MQTKPLFYVVGTITLCLMAIQPAMAGPGGKIASAAFESFWGRVILGLLTIFFLPLIVMVLISEHQAEKRARQDLLFVARMNSSFDWLNIQRRAKECFQRVHLGWQNGDLSDVSQWMTSWYWQNQQSTSLDEWKSQGLKNVCNVKKISKVKPLLFLHRNDGGVAHEGSQLIVSICAKMQDYLVEEATGKVVEGSKKWKDVGTLWTLSFEDGEWLVADIEEDALSHTYAKMRKTLPAIESTVANHLNA